MEAKIPVTVCLFIFAYTVNTVGAQKLVLSSEIKGHGICAGMHCSSVEKLRKLKDCVVILGNLTIWLDLTTRADFRNLSFPNLREITDFLTTYRISELYSLGELFPNLARIRGHKLFYDYALIIHDMFSLKEIGLYGLVRVDRGGVAAWGGDQTCFASTVRWAALAPRARTVVRAETAPHCPRVCSCSDDPRWNHCWNMRKCQRFLEGVEAERCHAECLGCRKTRPDECSVCRRFTHRRACVPECPPHTLVLQANQYCLTLEECKGLNGWAWNGSCVFDCPMDYIPRNNSGELTCSPCPDCQKTCGHLSLVSLEAVQAAEKCMFVNGSLVIHVRAVPYAIDELRLYLRNIQEVSDYIMISDSISITSLDFLSSLKRIRGKKLYLNKYSLVIHDMTSTQTLFSDNVTRNLQVDNGTLRVYNNPVLCINEINKLKTRFPVKPGDVDIPDGMNGFSAGCNEISVGFKVHVINETSALIEFTPLPNPHISYTVLYLKLTTNDTVTVVPETCSDDEWFAVHVGVKFGKNNQNGQLELTNLHPATTYAVCIETYDSLTRNLARTSIKNFTTAIGKPAPPFISELVASTSTLVVLRWVDHRDYKQYITHYELDVSLIEIKTKDLFIRNHCKESDVIDDADNKDPYRHATVMRPPPHYGKICESMCGILSSVTKGAMVEENFDVCHALRDCNTHEADPPSNTTFGNYIKSLHLTIHKNNTDYQVGGLAPFRDYRFRLRACSKESCSRSARSVVRTLRLENADMPVLTKAIVNKHGYVSVAWESATLTNGPILSYSVQIMPNVKLSDIGQNLPQVWCVQSNETETTVKVKLFEKYLIRICSTSLADTKVCADWTKLEFEEAINTNWWWIGIIFGILIYSVSVLIGFTWKPRVDHNDDIPLVDFTSMNRIESEPVVRASDFTPLYVVHLRDAN